MNRPVMSRWSRRSRRRRLILVADEDDMLRVLLLLLGLLSLRLCRFLGSVMWADGWAEGEGKGGVKV